MCLNPKKVIFRYYQKIDEKTGISHLTKGIRFVAPDFADNEDTAYIPCGKCAECRVQKSKDWAHRCLLESKKWPKNAFLTLTYNDDNLKSKKLVKEDLQKFWKRLRKTLKQKIKYLACGEYGTLTGRPHYHAAVFNYWPEDTQFYRTNGLNEPLYTSKTLEKIWGKGFVIVGALTYASAAYIARYVQKKAYGADEKREEFITMSRRPGIAHDIDLEQLKKNNGTILYQKNKMKILPIPQYTRARWRKDNPEEYYKYFEMLDEQKKKNIKEILQKTDKNFNHYEKMVRQENEKKLKRLDKYRNNY